MKATEEQQNQGEGNPGLSTGFCRSLFLWTESHSHPVFPQVTQALTHRLPEACIRIGHPQLLSSPCSLHGSLAHVPRVPSHLSASRPVLSPPVNLGRSQSTGLCPVHTPGLRLRAASTADAPSRGLALAAAQLSSSSPLFRALLNCLHKLWSKKRRLCDRCLACGQLRESPSVAPPQPARVSLGSTALWESYAWSSPRKNLFTLRAFPGYTLPPPFSCPGSVLTAPRCCAPSSPTPHTKRALVKYLPLLLKEEEDP